MKDIELLPLPERDTAKPAQREEGCATCGLGPPPDGFGCAWCGRQAASTPAPAQQEPLLVLAKSLLEDWADSFVDCIEGGEADEGVAATRSAIARIEAALAAQHQEPPQQEQAPIDMVLHCPACGMQHIDGPSEARQPRWQDAAGNWHCAEIQVWTNPPHRSHLCHGCGHIWRPADVPTNGVASVKTKGKADSPARLPRKPMTPSQREAIFKLAEAAMGADINLSWRHALVEAVERHHGIKE